MPETMRITEFTDHDHIRENLLPEVAAHMRKGADHYGPNNHTELGLKGQFADMYRKFHPLRRALWEGDTVGMKEGPREICLDLIGHCLLTIAMIDRADRETDDLKLQVKGPDINKLKEAGWVQDDNGVWDAPLPARIDRDLHGHSYLTDAVGVRRCSSCKRVMAGVEECKCDNAA